MVSNRYAYYVMIFCAVGFIAILLAGCAGCPPGTSDPNEAACAAAGVGAGAAEALSTFAGFFAW